MRTNIDIDDELLKEVRKFYKSPSKRALVDQGLKLLLQQAKRRSLFEIRGKIKFTPEFDYKTARE